MKKLVYFVLFSLFSCGGAEERPLLVMQQCNVNIACPENQLCDTDIGFCVVIADICPEGYKFSNGAGTCLPTAGTASNQNPSGNDYNNVTYTPDQSGNTGSYPAAAKVSGTSLYLFAGYLDSDVEQAVVNFFDASEYPYSDNIFQATNLLVPRFWELSISMTEDSNGYLRADFSDVEKGLYYRFSYRDSHDSQNGWAMYGEYSVLAGMEDPACVWCGTDTVNRYVCSLVVYVDESGDLECAGNQ